MNAIAVPLLPGKLAGWEAWIAELKGPRRAEFEAFNARHRLTGHHAWLQGTPDPERRTAAIASALR